MIVPRNLGSHAGIHTLKSENRYIRHASGTPSAYSVQNGDYSFLPWKELVRLGVRHMCAAG